MSQENVELARQYFAGLNAEGHRGARQMRHPDIELIDPPDFPDADRHVGEDAVQERVAGLVAMGWDGAFHVEEYVDAGDEVLVMWVGRLSARGMTVNVTFGHLLLFEDGRIRRIRQHTSRAEALEAVGLRE